MLVLLAATAVYAAWLARPVDLASIRRDGLATLFYVANWSTILRGASYWDISLAPSPLQHTWSLAIEEQFYLLWPLAIAALARRAGGDAARMRRSVGRLAIGLAGLSLVAFVALRWADASETRLYQGTDTRSFAILVGVLLAVHRDRIRGWLGARATEVIGVAAALALAVLWTGLDGRSAWLYRGGLQRSSRTGSWPGRPS